MNENLVHKTFYNLGGQGIVAERRRNSVSRVEMDVLRERYGQAVEYIEWFQPAWNVLSDLQRKILSEFYMGDSLRSGANIRLQNELGYCERQIGRLRAKALNRLVLLLFGR